MIAYISAGFTGSFLSYFTVFCFGANIYACAVDSVVERILRVMRQHNSEVEIKLSQILRQLKTNSDNIVEQKFDLIMRQLESRLVPEISSMSHISEAYNKTNEK